MEHTATSSYHQLQSMENIEWCIHLLVIKWPIGLWSKWCINKVWLQLVNMAMHPKANFVQTKIKLLTHTLTVKQIIKSLLDFGSLVNLFVDRRMLFWAQSSANYMDWLCIGDSLVVKMRALRYPKLQYEISGIPKQHLEVN